jgi:hypothetical protein
MRWVAVRCQGKVIEEFDAPADRELARAVAWSKWGSGVEFVQSFADHHEALREQEIVDRSLRLRLEAEYDGA